MGSVLPLVNGFSAELLRSKDWSDKLNSGWTVVMLLVCATVVTSSQLVGQPIHCWCPAQFTGQMVAYTNSYCWTKNTYYIPMNVSVPGNQADRLAEEINYYQWVPIVLLVQALLFKLPDVLWTLLHQKSGIRLDGMVEMAEAASAQTHVERCRTIQHLSNYIVRWLGTFRPRNLGLFVEMRYCFFSADTNSGLFLTDLFVIVKFLYCLNLCSQIFVLDFLLRQGDFGMQSLFEPLSRKEWQANTVFPLVTLCDFQIRQHQNLVPYTVQCVLPINLFNEKIFVFIRVWLLLIYFLTFYNFLACMFRSCRNYSYIKKYLTMTNGLPTRFDKVLCRRFARDYLRGDGVFVLRYVSRHASDLVTRDLVVKLWTHYRNQRRIVHHEIETDHIMARRKQVYRPDEQEEELL